MPAWNGWFHLMTNTYGTWLPGDGKGFRTRHHREHVEGDYKQPPPMGKYDDRLRRSRKLMKRGPVYLSREARVVAAEALRHALGDVHGIEVLAVAVTRMHVHVLARFPRDLARKPTLSKRGLRTSSVDDPPRHYMGIAKKEASNTLLERGLVVSGGAWAKRGKVKPIRDRIHQVRVFQYILDHIDEGGAVWCFAQPQIVRIKKPTD